MPRNDIILFCDLETTGVEEDEDNIIEVGISVVRWPSLDEDWAASYIVEPSTTAFERMANKAIVHDMHKANGLYDAIERGEGQPVDIVDTAIAKDLARYGTSASRHIPLAGSGVTHFDRRFIKRYLPQFDSRLTHWAYDVGVLRRMFVLAGATPARDDGKTHRALDDARVHAEEFKFYMAAIGEMYTKMRTDAGV